MKSAIWRGVSAVSLSIVARTPSDDMPAEYASQTTWAFWMTFAAVENRIPSAARSKKCFFGRVGGGLAGGGQTKGGHRHRCADELGDVAAGEHHDHSLSRAEGEFAPHVILANVSWPHGSLTEAPPTPSVRDAIVVTGITPPNAP